MASNTIFTTFVDHYKFHKENQKLDVFKTTSSNSMSSLKLQMLLYDNVPDGTKEMKKWLRNHHIGISTESQVRFRRDLYEDLFSRIHTAKHHDMLVSVSIYQEYKRNTNTMSDEQVMRNTMDIFGKLPSELQAVENPYHYLNAKGKRTCALIIGALKRALPQLDFCPAIKPIIVLLLHVQQDDEAIFMWVAKLCSKGDNKPKGQKSTTLATKDSLALLSTTQDDFICSSEIFQNISKKYASKFHSLGYSKKIKYKNYRSWLFERLPFYYGLLILDCYLLEGPKALYRFGVSVLRLYVKATEKSGCNKDGFLAIGTFCTKVLAVESITPRSFKKEAFTLSKFSRKDILKLSRQAYANLKNGNGGPDAYERSLRRNSHAFLTRHNDFAPSTSKIISHSQFCQIYNWLPEYFQVMTPRRRFYTSNDGFSYANMMLKTGESTSLIFILRNEMNQVFGFFLNEWSKKRIGHSAGTGVCVIFTLEPVTRFFGWTEKANLFYIADTNKLVIGGSGDMKNSALTLEKNFSKCTYGTSQTYALLSNKTIYSENVPNDPRNAIWSCSDVEVWEIQE